MLSAQKAGLQTGPQNRSTGNGSDEGHSHRGETHTVSSGTSRVSCNGGGGALGHPQIWLNLSPAADQQAQAVCPYCSRRFIAAD